MLPNLQYWKIMLKIVKEGGNNSQVPSTKGCSTKISLLKQAAEEFKKKF